MDLGFALWYPNRDTIAWSVPSVPRARPFAAKVSSRVAASTPAMELQLGFIGQTYLSAPGCFFSTSPLFLCSEMLNL